MITLSLASADTSQIRFAADAVWESAASLNYALQRPTSHPLHRRLSTLLPTNPDFDLPLLLALTATRGWVPDMLAPEPASRCTTALEQIAAVRSCSPDVARADLDVLLSTGIHPPATTWTPLELADRTATALAGFWRQVLEPLWEGVEAIVGADIALRAAQTIDQGIGPTINTLTPRVTYQPDQICVDLPGIEEHSAPKGHGVILVPSVFRFPGLAVNSSTATPVLSYPARGAGRLWLESRRRGEEYESPLVDLLGRSRAALLSDLHVPRTTTSLARRHDLAPATVSRHLSVLTAAGLLITRRDGRRVLYTRTPLAASLTATMDDSNEEAAPHDRAGTGD